MNNQYQRGFNGGRSDYSSDRRVGIRFPIEMELNYRVGGRSVKWIPGRTINISSSGLLMRTEEAPMPGSRVDVSLAWPQLLDDRVPLQLVVAGKVVRAVEGQVAVVLQRFEFKTARVGVGAVEEICPTNR